jgi:hypothetical protein
MDISMTLMKMAARGVAPGCLDLPASIAGANDSEATDNLLKLTADVANDLSRHTTDALTAALNDLLQRLAADAPTVAKIVKAMPGSTLEEALSVALRVCAGCTDGAKAVRKTEMIDLPDGGRGEREISQEERETYAHFLGIEAQSDRVYAAGVAIGPLDKKARHGQDPVFDGIPEADQGALFPEYFRRNPRK